MLTAGEEKGDEGEEEDGMEVWCQVREEEKFGECGGVNGWGGGGR